MPRGQVVVVGDSLLDRDIEGDVLRVCPDSPAPVLQETSVHCRPGGAALAATLVPEGHDVTLITAIAGDGPGRQLATMIRASRVELVTLAVGGTTAEKIRLRSGSHTLVRLDRGWQPEPPARPPEDVADLLQSAAVILVSDYGRGVAADPTLRRWLESGGRPVVWDPHLRGPDPVAHCRMVTPNMTELTGRFAGGASDEAGAGPGLAGLACQAREARARWQAQAVAVTRGGDGALLVTGDGPPIAIPTQPRLRGDTCGAGDCFAASVAGHLADGALPSEAAAMAVSDAGRFVAGLVSAGSDAGMSPPGPAGGAGAAVVGRQAALDLAAAVKGRGGTVVATGGCFDLLHAGHLSLLRSARLLGDCLIVCLNSDLSVRRLKGPGRPVVSSVDRAAMLASLDCVDAVCVFDEDTPVHVLEVLQPDVWTKGGDYDANSLPESATVSRLGGQAVILPYLTGRSTTDLIRRAATSGA